MEELNWISSYRKMGRCQVRILVRHRVMANSVKNGPVTVCDIKNRQGGMSWPKADARLNIVKLVQQVVNGRIKGCISRIMEKYLSLVGCRL